MTKGKTSDEIIKYLFPCVELATDSVPAVLEPWEEDFLLQLEKTYKDKISCHAFVRRKSNGQVYFDVYIIDPACEEKMIRFSIHKNKRLPEEEEKLFFAYVTNDNVEVDKEYFERFLELASTYVFGQRKVNFLVEAFMLKHLYCCYHDCPEKLLYNSGMFSIADELRSIESVNWVADNVSEMFDGMDIELLFMLNTPRGVRCMRTKSQREKLKEVYARYSNYMDEVYLEQSEIFYLLWCTDGVKEFDEKEYRFVRCLDETQELPDYMRYMDLREALGAQDDYPKEFETAEDMYYIIEKINQEASKSGISIDNCYSVDRLER